MTPGTRPARPARTLALYGALVAGLQSQRAIAEPVLPHGFVDTVVTTGLLQPVGMAWLPDGRLLLIEQKTSQLRLLVQDTLQPSPIFTVPELDGSGLERGLLGVAVDPGFPTRPYVYLYLSHRDTTPTNYVVRYTLSGDLADPASPDLQVDPASAFRILTDIPDNASNHNGGTLRFGPDRLLYVSIGEDAVPCAAQATNLLRGVLLRLDVSALPDGGGGPPEKSLLVPAGNPFTGPDDNARLTVAFGLRNPFRIHVDPASGRVFIADVGQSLFEEIDLLEPDALGQNYGWPVREGPVASSTCPGVPDAGPFSEPIAFYDRSGLSLASVISAGVYHAVNYPADRSFPPEYEGDYFFAEYYGGFLRRLHRDPDGTWRPAAAAPEQPSPSDWAEGISTAADFSVGPDGALYYVSQFGNGGSLHRISFVPDLVLRPSDAHGQPDEAGVAVTVRTSATITVGSTDVRLRFDPSSLEATGVTSDLESFVSTIDNVAGSVTTASASAAGQTVVADAPLFTVTFHVQPGASGCSALRVEDADGAAPDDLAGPIPPIPPATILYVTAPGSFCVPACGNGVLEAGEECDDGNRANGDCCDAACHFESAGTACADAPCAVQRMCDGHGACGDGTLRACDDGNSCTDDVCDARSGCVHTANATPCDDGNPCTTHDTCVAGACAGGPPPDCDDGDPCTADRCEAGACLHPIAVDCATVGDLDCDGRSATPLDAQVILCLALGRCTDGDVPPPCNDPAVRRSRSDWNLNGDVDATDAAITLDIFVGLQQVSDTPLGSCCTHATR